MDRDHSRPSRADSHKRKQGSRKAHTTSWHRPHSHPTPYLSREQKVGTVARAAVTKVNDVNQEYRITERVGTALLSGLNYLSTTSSNYLQSRAQADGSAAAPTSAPPTVATQPSS